MPAPNISREYRIYLALWRKATMAPEDSVSIKCSSLSMAIAMRQGMYRAIRPFRNGTQSDEQLRIATDKYVVYLQKPESQNKDEPHYLILKSRKALMELDSMWDQLGIDEEDLLVGDERRANQSLKKFLDEQTSDSAERPSTPFYTRD